MAHDPKLDALHTLRDIHLPQPVSAWPPSLFLICLLVITLISLIFLCIYIGRVYLRYRFQQRVLRELGMYEQDYRAGACTATIASQISSLLKRVAGVYFPSENMAKLYGEDWFLFLKKTATAEASDFLLIYFTQIPYQRDRQVDLNPLFVFAKQWVICQIKAYGGRRCLK